MSAMTTARPDWLTREAIACHPQRRLIFQPLRLRLERPAERLVIEYAPELTLPVSECRLAQVPDLLNEETAVYLAGQRYSKAVSGRRVRLSYGQRKYLIQLARDDCEIARFAQAFDGAISTLDDAQNEWIDQLFSKETNP